MQKYMSQKKQHFIFEGKIEIQLPRNCRFTAVAIFFFSSHNLKVILDWLNKYFFLSFLTQSNSIIQTSAMINGILFRKIFWPTVRKICSSDREKQEQFFERNTF